MGGQQSINRLKEVTEHPRLGRYVLSNQQGNVRMCIDVPFSSQLAIHAWIDNVQNLDKCRQTLFLPYSHQLSQQGFCGGAGLLKVQFDLFPYTLAEEIKNRYGLGCQFSEQQLWYLLFEICTAASHFQRRGSKAGDIRPQNVLISPEGTIKLFNRCSLPDEQTNYERALEYHQPAYLAPEQFHDLERGVIEPSSSPVVAEAFSVGLTVLDAALMQDSSSIYNMNSPSFRKGVFKQMIASCKRSNHGEFFTRTILNLLELDPSCRPTAGQVCSMLRPYEKEIRNLKPFAPNKDISRKSLQAYQQEIKIISSHLQTVRVVGSPF